MPDDTREEGKKHLTPERRDNYEGLGEEILRDLIAQGYYNGEEERQAALYWLGEKRKSRDRREWTTLGLVFVGVVLTAITLIVTLR
jgi:hypothetical protein